ncbi:PREDICTED: translocator protein homolog [Tarenaya hassleriana]|uniref:translocator protein homolog n=1 Tax=Tarenaya hassleriana TaxID=28532 RepID=UPI00053C0E80|nr:PREDICTED: translocator protein homolog [Tarenaya hassleriana]
MDPQELRRRGGDENVATATEETEKKNNEDVSKRDKKKAMAKRGLRSLAVAVTLPALLTLLINYFLGSGNGYGKDGRPSWFPPLWAFHVTCLGASFLMGLAAWLVWVDGGFHRKPIALCLYLGQALLSMAWDPIVFRAGLGWIGLAVWAGEMAALFGCYRAFKGVNPVAGDLVKPCLAWAAFVAGG